MASLRQADGSLADICSVVLPEGPTSARDMVKFVVDSGSTLPQQWTLRVLDSQGGGPTGEEPYVAKIEVANTSGPQLDLKSFDPPFNRIFGYWEALRAAPTATVPDCQHTTGALRLGSTLEVATVSHASSAAWPVPYLLYTRAGRRLYLRLNVDGGSNSTPVSGIISAKSTGEHPFVPICKFNIIPGTGQLIAAYADWTYVFKPVWRVDIDSVSRESSRTVSIELLRERESLQMAEVPTPQDIQLCMSGAVPRTQARKGGSTPFAAQSRMAVNVRFSGLVPHTNSNAILEQAVADSFAIWRQSCWGCYEFNFSFLDVNASRFALRGLYGELDHCSRSKSLAECESRWPGLINERAGTRTSGTDKLYISYNSDDAAIKYLCSADSSRLPAEWKQLQDSMVCQPDPELLDVVIMNKRTSCGDKPNIVGCRRGDLLQLNGLDYTFYVSTTDQIVAGGGATLVDLGLVLTHEIGHWIGLGHLSGSEGIMGEYAATNRCVDRVTIDKLQKVSSGAEPPDTKHSTLLLQP